VTHSFRIILAKDRGKLQLPPGAGGEEEEEE
jgi:hypothetical protein